MVLVTRTGEVAEADAAVVRRGVEVLAQRDPGVQLAVVHRAAAPLDQVDVVLVRARGLEADPVPAAVGGVLDVELGVTGGRPFHLPVLLAGPEEEGGLAEVPVEAVRGLDGHLERVRPAVRRDGLRQPVDRDVEPRGGHAQPGERDGRADRLLVLRVETGGQVAADREVTDQPHMVRLEQLDPQLERTGRMRRHLDRCAGQVGGDTVVAVRRNGAQVHRDERRGVPAVRVPVGVLDRDLVQAELELAEVQHQMLGVVLGVRIIGDRDRALRPRPPGLDRRETGELETVLLVGRLRRHGKCQGRGDQSGGHQGMTKFQRTPRGMKRHLLPKQRGDNSPSARAHYRITDSAGQPNNPMPRPVRYPLISSDTTMPPPGSVAEGGQPQRNHATSATTDIA